MIVPLVLDLFTCFFVINLHSIFRFGSPQYRGEDSVQIGRSIVVLRGAGQSRLGSRHVGRSTVAETHREQCPDRSFVAGNRNTPRLVRVFFLSPDMSTKNGGKKTPSFFAPMCSYNETIRNCLFWFFLLRIKHLFRKYPLPQIGDAYVMIFH